MHGHNEVPRSSFLKRCVILFGAALLGMSLSLASTADDDDDDDDDRGSRLKYQTANIVDFTSGEPEPGAATLTRSRNSVTASVHAAGLESNAAYSIWWVIWNKPWLCNGDCGEDDLEIRGNGVFWAGGFVTGDDGTANTTLSLRAGRLPEGLEVLIGGGLDRGNGFRAEMHLVIRSHGLVIPDIAAIQIGTFGGGCDPDTDEPCYDHQAVVFKP